MTTPTPAALAAANRIANLSPITFGALIAGPDDKRIAVTEIAKEIDSALAAERARVAVLRDASDELKDVIMQLVGDPDTYPGSLWNEFPKEAIVSERTARNAQKALRALRAALAAMETK